MWSREELLRYVIEMRCEIEGIDEAPAKLIEETHAMSTEELDKEADWLYDMSGK